MSFAGVYGSTTEEAAHAVLAASVFHYGTFTIERVKEHLRDHGFPVRIGTGPP